jgi:hypothetical protein
MNRLRDKYIALRRSANISESGRAINILLLWSTRGVLLKKSTFCAKPTGLLEVWFYYSFLTCGEGFCLPGYSRRRTSLLASTASAIFRLPRPNKFIPYLRRASLAVFRGL